MDRELQNVLDKLDVVRIRQELTRPSDKFNIFRILRSESDEVNLHSRFLFELLNPNGSHGLGDAFLRLFIKECQLQDLNYGNVKVMREHANIDVLIQDNLHAIVIENKIYAGDQHEQLNSYHQYVGRNRRPKLLYLTLRGEQPSDWSIGELKNLTNYSELVQTISYSKEINDWLTDCIKEAVMQPALRETLVQYQNLIRHLSGSNMDENEKQDVLHLLSQDNNAERAVLIARNWNHVRWHAEWDFWTELETLVERTYKISSTRKFSDDKLSVMIHGSRNRDPHYGLMFCVGNFQGSDVNVAIERGAWGPLFYGFHLFSSDATINVRAQQAMRAMSAGPEESWTSWKYPSAEIDFNEFSNSVTLQLANPDKRKKIVAALWQECQAFIKEGIDVLEQEFGIDFLPSSVIEQVSAS